MSFDPVRLPGGAFVVCCARRTAPHVKPQNNKRAAQAGGSQSSHSSSSLSTAINASVGSCTDPRERIFLPAPQPASRLWGPLPGFTCSAEMNSACAKVLGIEPKTLVRRTAPPRFTGPRGQKKMLSDHSSSSLSTAINASVGSCTDPRERIFFLPSFCFSSSFFFRVMSPP